MVTIIAAGIDKECCLPTGFVYMCWRYLLVGVYLNCSLATGRQDPLVFIFYNEMLARVDMLVIVYIRADLFIFVVDRRDWKN